MKKILCMILSLVMVFGMMACAAEETPEAPVEDPAPVETPVETPEEPVETPEEPVVEEPVEEPAEELTFGWSVYDLANPFFVPMDEGVQSKCAELGINLLPTHDEKGDATEMITGVNNLIAQGIDALVISPFSPESLGTVTAACEAAGIPVVVVDIGTGGNQVDAFIMSDMYGGGKACGEYFLSVVDPAASKNVAIIKCETSATYAITRGEGFKDAVTAAGYTVVDEQHGNSNKDEAYAIMQDYLAAYTDLSAVFCENDQMALGAAAAIDEAGKTGEILVYGFDGNDDAVAAILEGRMGGTVAQNPFAMGETGVELALKLVNGEELTSETLEEGTGNKIFWAPIQIIDQTGNKI